MGRINKLNRITHPTVDILVFPDSRGIRETRVSARGHD